MTASRLVQMLTEFAAACDEEYTFGESEDNAPVRAIILVAIRDLRADLQALYKDVEQDLMDEAGNNKRFVVDGVGEFEIKRSTKRNEWDHEGIIRKLVAMAADERQVDPQTGEIVEREGHAVPRVIAECAGISYWRVTPLRARHIPVDEYCSETPDSYSVKLPPRGQ